MIQTFLLIGSLARSLRSLKPTEVAEIIIMHDNEHGNAVRIIALYPLSL